jgi:NAD(P)-dependent dehydrogenase (short-subunit alcohol dehydrogenase family)
VQAVVQSTIPNMLERGERSILLTGGGLALYPSADAPTLSIAKTGIRSLAATLHQELQQTGIRVGTVTVCGEVNPGGAFAPDLTADALWSLHSGEVDGPEIVFDRKVPAP